VARSLDDELRKLYGLPLEEFTAARNELAGRLKQDADPRAEEIRGLRKPTVPVWAVNQLARSDELGVRRLLAAGAALRKAQEQALEGAGAGLAKAQTEEREAVRKLTQRARALLSDAGRPATDGTLERGSKTLSAAAIDESAREALKAGLLDRELEPLGFDALAGIRVSPTPPRGTDTTVADRRRQETEERRRRELRARVRELEREAREAERTADRAEAEARKRREAADAARSAADRASAELEE
jgi:hypothetical protein